VNRCRCRLSIPSGSPPQRHNGAALCPGAAFNYARVACNEANCFLLSIKVKFSHLAASARPHLGPIKFVPWDSHIATLGSMAFAVTSVVKFYSVPPLISSRPILSQTQRSLSLFPFLFLSWHTSVSAPEQLLLPQQRSSFASAKSDIECVS